MTIEEAPFSQLLSAVIDNRGRTCPTSDTGIPLIATNCIRNELLYPTYEKARFVSQETHESWFRGHPEPGDILFVNKATPGRVCLVPDPIDFCIAQDMVAVRANPKKVYPRYLFAVLRSPVVQERIGQMHVGSLIPHFKKGDFDKLLLPIPSRAAQEFIGDIYFDLSAKIELNRRCNETLEAMARALFQDWFVDFGPVRAKLEGRAPYLPPDLWNRFPDRLDDGGKPEGGRRSTLADFAILNPESWSKKNAPDEIEYVDLANTKRGMIETTARLPWSEAPSRAQRILRNGDTIVGTVRPGNGSYALVGTNGLTGSTGFAVLRPKQEIFRDFVFLAATSPESIERLTHLADGAAYPAVRPDVVLASPVFTPATDSCDGILKGFSDSASTWIDSIEHNKRESQALAQIRNILLPKLISGESRIADAERFLKAEA